MSFDAIATRATQAAYAKLGERVTYEPRDGAPRPITVVRNIRPSAVDGFQTGARQTETVIRVMTADVAEPKRGDTLTVADGACFEVRDADAISRWEWELIVA